MKTVNRLLSSLTIAAVLAGCLTLNVNLSLPEAAVQRATDDYVRELYRSKEKGKTPASDPTTEPTKAPKTASFSLMNEAWAAEFSITSAKAMEIREKLAGHLDEVIAQKRAGALGETNDGYLELRAGAQVKPLLLKKLQKVVADENALRKELYEEVLSSNKLERSQLKEIQAKFANSFQSQSPTGTWMQDSEGKWLQKP